MTKTTRRDEDDAERRRGGETTRRDEDEERRRHGEKTEETTREIVYCLRLTNTHKLGGGNPVLGRVMVTMVTLVQNCDFG
jgi:hypothetical protein